MGDAENTLPPSRKRAAGRELSRDNPGLDDEEEFTEQETGTFKRASEEVLAGRRIVKVRRQQTPATSAPSSNPFAGIRLAPPTASSATPDVEASEETVPDEGKGQKEANEESGKEKEENGKQFSEKLDVVGAESTADEKKTDALSEAAKPEIGDVQVAEVHETEDEKKEDTGDTGTESEDKKDNITESVEKSADAKSFSSFQQLSSSQNAFTGLAGTGFSSGQVFSFGPSGNGDGNLSLFGNSGPSLVCKNEGRTMHEVSVETGEENEEAVFTADSVLFEFLDGGWKERGKGELKVNVSSARTGKARLVMRARGNYRLILNASLYPDMKLTNMEKKGITFACVNSTGEGKDSLSTFALKFKDATIVEEFRVTVAEHKAKPPVAMKTPENSPKASDD